MSDTGLSKLPRLRSTCPHDCPSTCALSVEISDARTIGRVYGANDHPYTRGVICAKVSRYAERVHHRDRLSVPLRRVGPKGLGVSAFEPLGWDDALDIVAGKFRQIIDQHGAEAIWPYHFAGTMGLLQRDGIDRLRNVLGTSQQHSTFCTALSDAGWNVGVGAKRGANTIDMEHSDLIVIWGGNPVSTQVNIMHYLSQARKRNHATVVVVDPYRTGTADKADIHLMLRPGTDGALACAVMHVLLRDGLVDRGYLARLTDFDATVEQHLQKKTPEWAAALTGLSAAEIENFARLYGATPRSFIRVGYGFTRSRNGAVNMHAVTCLPALTGAWQHRGGGALYGNKAIYPVDATLIRGLDHQREDIRVLDQSRIGEVLCGNVADLQDGPAIQALFVQNTNPALVAPDSTRVLQGLSREELFVCVQEQFMTATASMADIVLPATMFLEHDDLYIASGHTWMQVARPVIEAHAECRSNHQVLCGIASRLGLQHEGFELDDRGMVEQTLQRSGLPDGEAIHAAGGHDCSLAHEQANFLDKFATDDGRFHFKPNWRTVGPNIDGMPALPDHWAVTDDTTEDLPFRLVAAPARQFLNTSFTECETSRRMERTPTVKIHPDDCVMLALEAGEMARISNRRGEILVETEPFDGVQRGTVVIESIWPADDFQGGQGVNSLISADAAQPNGGAVFHDTAVAVNRV